MSKFDEEDFSLRWDWTQAVAQHSTLLGYWEWVQHQLDEAYFEYCRET